MKPKPLSTRSVRMVPVFMCLYSVVDDVVAATCARSAPGTACGLLALEPAVGAGPHVLQRDDQPFRLCGLIGLADFVAVDPAHVALLEVGHGVQVDRHSSFDLKRSNT